MSSEQALTVERRVPALVGVGFVGGLLAGIFGVGGGVVLVPLMVTVLGVRQHLAHGTSLAIVAATALVAGIRYAQQGFLPPDVWVLAAELIAGTVIGVTFGARLMSRVPASRLRQIFGVFIVLLGLRMLLALGEGSGVLIDWRTDSVLLLGGFVFAVGLLVGVLSGLLGVGGGVFLVPFLALAIGVPQHIAQAISLAVVVPTGVVGARAHYRRGNVNRSLALWIGLGSVVAALVGSQLAAGMGDEVLRRLFGLLLAATGVRMLWPKRG